MHLVQTSLTSRASNMELLRIVAFLMVICIHVAGVGLSLNTMPTDSLNWHFSNLANSMSRASVLCFVLITGYFMSSNDGSIRNKLKKIGYPFVIYGIIIYFSYLFKLPSAVPSLKGAVQSFLTSSTIFYHFWYVCVYLGLVLLSPFINAALNRISQKQMKILLFILYGITSILPTINQFAQSYWVPDALLSSRLTLFITLYIQGAYLKQYEVHLSGKFLLLIYFVSSSLTAAFTWIYSSMVGTFVSLFYDYSNVFVVVSAVSLFIFFMKWKIPHNRVINSISSKTYGGYLVHTLAITFIQNIYSSVSPFLNYEYWLYPFLIVLYIMMVFISSIGLESLRQFMMRMVRLNKLMG